MVDNVLSDEIVIIHKRIDSLTTGMAITGSVIDDFMLHYEYVAGSHAIPQKKVWKSIEPQAGSTWDSVSFDTGTDFTESRMGDMDFTDSRFDYGRFDYARFNIRGGNDINIRKANAPWNLKAAYSFTDDTVGENPVGWTVYEPATTHVEVVSDRGTHNKVVEMFDNGTTLCYIRNSWTARTEGTIEWWFNRKSGYTAGAGYIQFILRQGVTYKLGVYVVGSGIYPFGPGTAVDWGFTNDKWHHFKVGFNTDTDKFNLHMNGSHIGEYNFSSTATSLSMFEAVTHTSAATGSTYFYVDAVDYSWNSGYFDGRNKTLE